jgi:hypothetical protein
MTIHRSHDASDRYRGIAFLVRSTEIPAFSDRPAKVVWCHYVFLHERQVPDATIRDSIFLTPKLERITAESPERVHYEYYKSPIADLEWHGGITFYDMVCAVPGHRVLKAGCDYQHYWDEERWYDEAGVIAEAKATIDSMYDRWSWLVEEK